jgi:hypothetical protein
LTLDGSGQLCYIEGSRMTCDSNNFL